MDLIIQNLYATELEVTTCDTKDGLLQFRINYTTATCGDINSGKVMCRGYYAIDKEPTKGIMAGTLAVCERASTIEGSDSDETPIRLISIRGDAGLKDVIAIGHSKKDQWCHFDSDGEMKTLKELLEISKAEKVFVEDRKGNLKEVII